MTSWVGHLSLNGQGIYQLMGGALWHGWGTYGLNGWGSYDKVSCCFVWKYAQKIAGLQGSTLSDHRMTTGFGPFELPIWDYYREGGTTPHLRLVLFEEPSFWLAFKVL